MMNARQILFMSFIYLLINALIWPLPVIIIYASEVLLGNDVSFPMKKIQLMVIVGIGLGVCLSLWNIIILMNAATHAKRMDLDFPGGQRVIPDMDNALIMLSGDGDFVSPLHAYQLRVPKGSKKNIYKHLNNALIVPLEGPCRTLHHPVIRRPWGNTRGQRLLSRLCSAWVMDIDIRDANVSLDQVKKMIIERLAINDNHDNFYFRSKELDEKITLIRSSESTQELFAAVGLAESDYQ